MPRKFLPLLALAAAALLLIALAALARPLLENDRYLPLVSRSPLATATQSASALIVNHLAPAAFPDIPDSARLAAAGMPILVRHASVGENISDGLDCLAGAYPTTPGCESYTPGTYDRSHWDYQNRGNPGWLAKIQDLVDQTALQQDDFDAFTMKFCYIDALGSDSPDWETYRDAMLQLEADYPGKTFIWWTVPLTSDGNPGADEFNALVRSYAREHGKVLFDIAAIESHDPAGNPLTSAAGDEILYAGYTDDGGHLNWTGRIRVAKAFWVLAARLNGWVW